jgi:RNA polymerase sigma factor (sigma-70 family)
VSDLYARYHAQIHRFCLRELRSREEAEDATQTTFLNALRGLHRGVRPELESAWLYAIAQNVCRTRRRASWRRGRVERPDDLDTLEQVVAAPGSVAREELMGLSAALESMPESQRQAILLREWKGLSYDEIGSEMGLSHSAVETLIFRARRRLARGLQQLEPKHLRQLADGGGLLGFLKVLLAGGAAGKAIVTGAAALLIGGTVIAGEQIANGGGHAKAPARAHVVAPPGSPQQVGSAPQAPGADVSRVVAAAGAAVDRGRSTTGSARVGARHASVATPADRAVDGGQPLPPAKDSTPSAGSNTPLAERGVHGNPAGTPDAGRAPGKPETKKAQAAEKPVKASNGRAGTNTRKGPKAAPAKDAKQTPPGQAAKDEVQTSSAGSDQSSQGNGNANANGQDNANANGQDNANANGQDNGNANGQGSGNANANANAQSGAGAGSALASTPAQGKGSSKK